MNTFDYDEYIGRETKEKEYKVHSLHKCGISIDLDMACRLCESNEFIFNDDIIKSIKKYIKLYLPKYICGYLNSNIPIGEFYIGVTNMGFIRGIPYKGVLPKNVVKDYINKIIKKNIVSISNENIDIKDMIDISFINVNMPDKPENKINPRYTNYVVKKTEFDESFTKYLKEIDDWKQKYDVINYKLVDIFNETEQRNKLIEYIENKDPTNIVLEMLQSKYQLNSIDGETMKDLKTDPTNPYHWVTTFKDDLTEEYRKNKPRFNSDFPLYHLPINMIINTNDMIPYWMHCNDNMNLYVIHITINNTVKNNTKFKYYDPRTQKWIKCFRIVENDEPLCIPEF